MYIYTYIMCIYIYTYIIKRLPSLPRSAPRLLPARASRRLLTEKYDNSDTIEKSVQA